MSNPSEKNEEIDLKRLNQFKRTNLTQSAPLGPDLLSFFKNTVQKRQAKFGKLADAWSKFVPEFLDHHCSLESFHRGTLMVLVDSSPHLYELRQLLLSGIEKQLILACKSTGLKKISLKPGRWYDPTQDGSQKLRFD